MPATYTLALLRGSARPEWSRFMPFRSDEEAISAAGRIAEAEIRRWAEPVSVMVGRGADDGEVLWLGGWDCSAEGAVRWEPEPEPEDFG